MSLLLLFANNDELSWGVQSLMFASAGKTGNHAHPVPMARQNSKSIGLFFIPLSGAIRGAGSMPVNLHGSGIRGVMSIPFGIEDAVFGALSSRNKLSDSPRILSTTWDIKLDDISIANMITGCKISSSEDSVSDQIEITGKCQWLYQKANPNISSGTARIIVTIGSRIIYFLCEERGAESPGPTVTIKGRNYASRIGAPYESESIYTAQSNIMASAAAAAIVNPVPLTWTAADYALPLGSQLEGTPIEQIIQLADQVQAIVRCTDAGGLIVQKRYSTRPVNYQYITADIEVNDADHLIVHDMMMEYGGGYDSIHVEGYCQDTWTPSLEIEDGPRDDGVYYLGDTCFVRMYWTAIRGFWRFSVYLTSGTGGVIETYRPETRTETIQFTKGTGNTQYYIDALTGIEWIGQPGGNLQPISGENIILLVPPIDAPTIVGGAYTADNVDESLYGLAKVTYKTKYDRIAVFNAAETSVLLYLVITPIGAIDVLVKFGSAGTNEAEALQASFLTNDYSAAEAGIAWLDHNTYDRFVSNIEIPYDDAALSGNIIGIHDAELGLAGNYHIQSSEISIEGSKVKNQLIVVQHLAGLASWR